VIPSNVRKMQMCVSAEWSSVGWRTRPSAELS